MPSSSDVVIFGAGVIGLTLALELHRRGRRVALYDPRAAATQASWAAAGMLAVHDPHNPPQLAPFSRLSAALYPAFLRDLEELSSEHVPFQTCVTWQHMPDGRVDRLAEFSLDPRQLALALVAAIRKLDIPLRQASLTEVAQQPSRQRVPVVIHATGAWASHAEVAPRKGQMVRVQLPDPSRLQEVHRSETVYIVPRTAGPQAGTALIGATVEDAGFDTETTAEDLTALRQRGAALLPFIPDIADPRRTPLIEAWAGLRPASPDGLPLLGELAPANSTPGDHEEQRHLVAGGHFRNGILLAPGTAVLVADLLDGQAPAIDLTPFDPSRFRRLSTRAGTSDQDLRYSAMSS